MESKKTIERYDEIMKEARNLMIDKNKEYGDSWKHMRLPSITDQILVKVHRIRKLEEAEAKAPGGVESEYLDIINYCAFALIKIREKQIT